MISEAKWNELFGESDDEEEFVGFDAESGEGRGCYKLQSQRLWVKETKPIVR